jgi:hypothetical protein
MDPVTRLRRWLPALEPEDARQYWAEAVLALGPEASEQACVEAALARARADGYADPLIHPVDGEDPEGHPRSWLATLSDEGAGAAVLAERIGAGGSAVHRRRPVSPRRLRRLVCRVLTDTAGPDRVVLGRRWGRLLAGLAPATFRQAAQAARVALGTAWNIEARAVRLIRALARRPEQEPDQLHFEWSLEPAAGPPEADQGTRPELEPEPADQLALPW